MTWPTTPIVLWFLVLVLAAAIAEQPMRPAHSPTNQNYLLPLTPHDTTQTVSETSPPPVTESPVEHLALTADSPTETPNVAYVTGDGVLTYREPDIKDATHWFSNPTEFGGPRVFMVVGSQPGWLEVSLPLKPNGQTGWIRSKDVTVQTVTHRAEVDLANRRLKVWDGDTVITDAPVVIGAQWTPTPVGTFYVRDKVPQANPKGSFGPWALALSGFSETLTEFNGKQPVIAVHGTNRPELVGSARSNGCIRVPNELIAALAEQVPLGTPVTVLAGTDPEVDIQLADVGVNRRSTTTGPN